MSVGADSLPLFHCPDPAAPMAWRAGRVVSRAEFLADAAHLARELPANACAVNLCQDRYLFSVAFAAVLMRGGSNLLPAQRAPDAILEAAARFDARLALVDAPCDDLDLPQLALRSGLGRPPAGPQAVPLVAANHAAAVTFSSGSTGQPKANVKTWGALRAGVGLGVKRFPPVSAQAPTLVGTVPPQHMYGLESAVLYAWFGDGVLCAERPFYPEDLRRVLGAVPSPAVLITTPVHLGALVRAGLDWRPPRLIISATAPLSAALAQQAEHMFGCPVWEIFGCTEAGAVASRRTVDGPQWQMYDGLQLLGDGHAAGVKAPYLAGIEPLQDVIRVGAEGRFELLGRFTEQVKIAGKRSSLPELNHRLLSVPGVIDGVFAMPEEDPERVTRLVALVVAPKLGESDILRSLERQLDPVFLPRPLIKVERLPRLETGKLDRATLLRLLRGERKAG